MNYKYKKYFMTKKQKLKHKQLVSLSLANALTAIILGLELIKIVNDTLEVQI